MAVLHRTSISCGGCVEAADSKNGMTYPPSLIYNASITITVDIVLIWLLFSSAPSYILATWPARSLARKIAFSHPRASRTALRRHGRRFESIARPHSVMLYTGHLVTGQWVVGHTRRTHAQVSFVHQRTVSSQQRRSVDWVETNTLIIIGLRENNALCTSIRRDVILPLIRRSVASLTRHRPVSCGQLRSLHVQLRFCISSKVASCNRPLREVDKKQKYYRYKCYSLACLQVR